MGSRLRANPDKLFEVFVEVGRPEKEGEEPLILQKYPPGYDEQDVLKNIPKFAFPCKNNTAQVDQFAFVLTDLESMYRFGYCRHGAGAQTCLCIISDLPWFDVFYKMLNFLAEIINRSENSDLMPFVRAAYEQSIPMVDEPVTIVAGQDMFNFTAPDPTNLPTIPASRNLTEYYNAVDTNNMMRIFASMLHERRIIITSKKLSRVTACIHASEALLYPMHWQHLFIPVLPAHLLDYVAAPMPYLIGVHSSLMEIIETNRMEIGDAVIVDADKNEVRSQYDDLEALPEDVSSYLKRHLKTQKVQTSMMESGDAISRAFLQALVRLIGGYRDALKFRADEPITFDRDAFVQSRSSQSMQAFLESMLQLQIFQQFIKDRLELLNRGEGFHDLFEQESIKYADSLNTQSKYKEWLSKQKRKLKAGGKDIISDMREKAAPMMNTAVHTMKVQGKKFQSKIREATNVGASSIPPQINENKMSSRKVSGGVVHHRQHPTTIIGSQATSSRPPRPPPPSTSANRPHTVMMSTLKIDRSKLYKTLSMEEDHGSHDDSNLRLSYHSVDVSLMSDTDIQNAMMRSASAETLPHQDAGGVTQSASDGDISSTPSSEALSPSDENLTHIPYVDIGSNSHHHHHHVSPFAPNSSSEEDLAKPPPLPSKGSKPGRVSDRLVTSDRLITSSQSTGSLPTVPPRPARKSGNELQSGKLLQQSPKLPRPPVPMPRRSSLEKLRVKRDETPLPQKIPENPLIRFESSESETDGVEQFDPLMRRKPSAGKSPAVGNTADADNSPTMERSLGLTRNKSSRNSLMRVEAFRRAAASTPVRNTYREDTPPDTERDPKDSVADLFDPLASVSSAPPSSSPSTTAGNVINHNSVAQSGGGVKSKPSASLMHDWTLDQLAGRGGFSHVPSGATLTCPASSATPPPRPVSPVPSAGTNPIIQTPPPRPPPPSGSLADPFSVDTSSLQSKQPFHPALPPRPAPPQSKPQKTDPLDSLIPLALGSSAATKPASGMSVNSNPVLRASAAGKAGGGMAAGRNTLPAPSATPPLPRPQPAPRKSWWETFD